MTQKVTILSGISGSGKATYANELAAFFPTTTVIVSSDYFFKRPDGSYHFDGAKLGESHGACLRAFLEALASGVAHIIVDNTNATAVEISPYAALAEAFGCQLEIVTLRCTPAVAAERSAHAVPLKQCQVLADRIKTRLLPSRWPHRMIERG